MFALIAGVVFAAFAAWPVGWRKAGRYEIYRVGRVALLRMAQELVQPCRPQQGSTRASRAKNADGGTGHDRIDFLTIPYRRYSDKVPSYELCHVAYYVADNPQGKTALFREGLLREEDERRERASRWS